MVSKAESEVQLAMSHNFCRCLDKFSDDPDYWHRKVTRKGLFDSYLYKN